jgi:hypothetical protein
LCRVWFTGGLWGCILQGWMPTLWTLTESCFNIMFWGSHCYEDTNGTILFIKCTMELCCLQNVQWLVQMDNVLIDDRRIHVDFSQSVSRLWNRYRKFGTKSSGEGQWLEWLNLMHLICILQWTSRSYSKYKRPTDTLEARSMTIYLHSYIDTNNIIWYHWP